MIVPDEVVIEALLKDARKFKSKWELHTGEPTRSKPNVVFLKRTLSNVVKVNENHMRKQREAESCERDMNSSSKEEKDRNDFKESSSPKESRRGNSRRSKKSGCSKSKYRSPDSRSRSSKKSSKRKREISDSDEFPKR